ncbi:MAG: efflux RND transporter permease subunit, partial [Gammaproteobacteria bacterium]
KLPQMEGIRIFFLDNQAQGVKDSLSDLLSSGLIGAGLSLIVLYFFLRQVTTTLMVTLAVPFSIFISLAVMYFSGITLNILSMMGLMLAVGMLVDNAVVITENIFRHKKMDPSRPREATIRGTREVLLAVTAGTLTTVIVFVPNIFGVQNNITVFLKHVAISIVVALLASLLISVTMIPMIASRIHARPPEKGGTVIDRFKVRYRRLLEWTLQRRWLAIIGILVVLGSVVVPGAAVKKDMFPNDNNNRRLFLSYNVNSTYTLDKVESAVSKIENYLYANKKKFEITSVYSYFEPARAESTILLDDGPDAKKSDAQIMEEIRKGLPKLAIAKPSFDEKRTGSNEGVRVQIKGKSSEVLARMSHDVARALGTIDGLVDVHSEATAGQEEVQVTVDRDRAILYGLDTRQIAQAIAVAMRGQNLRHFRGRDGEIPIHLEFRKGDRDSLSKLEQLPLYTSSGDRIPLSAVAKLEVRSGPTAIQRENRVTAIGITAGLKDGATMDSVKPKIRQVMDELRMPPGYSWDFGQGFQQEDETASVMLTNMLLAVLLIYIVMAALFEAVLHPLAIISSIIFSIIGVFWFFLVTNTTFSFMAMIGILILMGVVVNNGIVMVDHINNLRREGHDRRHAILQACEDRLQPILMTVCTTILGLIPLAIGNTQVGGDGPPYFPMARAIIGGLAFSTLVSLVMLPTIYCLVDDLGLWATELWRRARGGHAEPARESASGK